ncbi:hypothetical protein H072_9928 [Dactylellina haptotyla CBS 200.50]|uniref:Bromodomain-containing protein n=1 Tax=Dactylellina haptotyla (strain CBS 200.50) TaxID=1284197 RepID=S8A0M1_DACHA|nr:hypothetical protein H072_9928 [Dactylellina haptotyla CBS 200.50]
MANLPSSASPTIPASDPDTSTSSSKQIPPISTTTSTETTSPAKRDESLAVNQEPDTAVPTSDPHGDSHDNSTSLKPITAPLSPPIPTPPFTESFDTSAPGQRAMSNLTLESPEATSKPIEPTSTTPAPPPPVAGESAISQQPNTAVPAVVEQPTSDVRDEPKSSESPEVQMEDAAPAAPATEPAAPVTEAPKPVETAPTEQEPVASAQDAEMPDAPADVSSPPSIMSSSLVRARSESAEPERPNKRQKTAEPESLPDAAALEHPATTNGGPVKPEVQSPVDMDTSMDQPTKSEEPKIAETFKTEAAPASKFTGEPMPQHQNRFALSALKNIKRLKDAAAFLAPVDPVKLALPTYLEIVKEPISLQEIEKKLVSNEYHNPEEVIYDFNLMIQNSVLFNGTEHTVTQSGRHIQVKFLSALEKMPAAEIAQKPKPQPKRPTVSTTNVTPAVVASPVATTPDVIKVDPRHRRESTRASAPTTAMSPTAASPTFSLTPGGVPQIRRDSIVTADGRPKRPIHAPPPKDLPYSDLKPRRKKSVAEFKFCEGIMKELWKKQHQAIAYPFYNPVDPVALEIPDYFKVIKKPMDMSEIQRKLNHNEYNNSNEFEADMRLMFNNCYKFNPPDSPVFKCGKSLEAVFDEKWAQKPSFKEETPTPPVVEDEEEEESEEEESEDEASPQLEKLEAQLSRLHSEIETIRKQKKSKKASPPAASKKHKKSVSAGSATGKSGSKAAPAAAPPPKKKSSKKKSEPTTPYMTFAQKQELSERINTLSPAKMHQALNLIKANHPHLAQDGDEIELDIDELAPATLHKLYKFVSENTLAPEPAVAAAPVAPAPKNTKSAPSKPRKKNKPMSATEQERKIRELQSQISGFEGGSPTDEGPRSLASMGAKQAESSSDDDSSSGSESEEE